VVQEFCEQFLVRACEALFQPKREIKRLGDLLAARFRGEKRGALGKELVLSKLRELLTEKDSQGRRTGTSFRDVAMREERAHKHGELMSAEQSCVCEMHERCLRLLCEIALRLAVLGLIVVAVARNGHCHRSGLCATACAT